MFQQSDQPVEERGNPTAALGASTPAWRLMILASAGVTAGAVAVVLMGFPRLTRAPAVPAGMPAPAVAPAPIEAEVAAPPPLPPVRAPKWTAVQRGQRFPDGSRMVAFELKAERYVPVWRQQVHPALNVRCLGGVTDVFVSTGWPASFEPEAGRHSVRLAFDDDELGEQWLDSDDYKALFAPDGVSVARRLSRARTLRFGFTPFNASPVVVEFDVRGFDALVGSIARACRWKP